MADMNMIERIGRAIAKAEGYSYDPYPYDIYAKAALAAMREPTDAMVLEGARYFHDNWRKDHVREDTDVVTQWQDMIDAALNPPS